MDNRYVNRAKISEAKFRELVRFFAEDLTASQMGRLLNLNRNTVNRYVNGIRGRITEFCDLAAISIPDNREDPFLDHSGRLLAVREREQKIRTELFCRKLCEGMNGRSREEQLQLFRERSHNVDCYDMLVDLNGNRQWIFFEPGLDAKGRKKLNRLENFWGYTKSRLSKFKGLRRSTIRMHVKESEFRYMHDQDMIYAILLKILRKNPLF